ncbi:hypothetical protein [Saccharopolyspora sp. ASAGF58]|uniref:hypothetical protein n=1 Tax=Saccharopolyspora sp. ASAGF58 TaxID=2719023 RepID=UPI001FF0D0EE|nr:hypothetical protein [Saccharopolyspora sp. ASAGF58]
MYGFQRHVWSEVLRHRLEIVEDASPDRHILPEGADGVRDPTDARGESSRLATEYFPNMSASC